MSIAPLPVPEGIDEGLFRACEAYMRYAHDVLKSYLDAMGSLDVARREVIARQLAHIEQLKTSEPHNATMEYLDQASGVIHKLEGNPGKPDEEILQMTYSEFKERTSMGGRDGELLGHMLIALLYGAWEDQYREQIATAKGLSKNVLKDDLFGDLRLFRIAVIHNAGIGTSDLTRLKKLKWFKPGDRVHLTIEMAYVLYREVDLSIGRICGLN